ncbi:HAD family hydrolase [Promethearchaeum syntrophicum]|uniref:HAD family hydrolase n=1 Tax=Promethearchaeum syntrophicum TaxID=2594042 RepID=A0A5B9DFM0_9ARCH|nr:HAD family hydrolase [Candidatus Prometheoarchaeum syntrophicum]
MLHAITFDLWNTLIANRFYGNQRLDYLIDFLHDNSFKVSWDELKEKYNRVLEKHRTTEKKFGIIHFQLEDRLIELFTSLNLDITPMLLKKIIVDLEDIMMLDPPPLMDNVKETIEYLSKDFKLGLISDTGITPGRVLRKVLEKHEILRYFQTTVFSNETGYLKPSNVMFETALKELGIKSPNALHIGDLLQTDIKGAKDYGMKAIWISYDRIPLETNSKIQITPDFIISNIQEIIPIVEKLNKKNVK